MRWARISAILCLSSSNFFLNWAMSETGRRRKGPGHTGAADLPLLRSFASTHQEGLSPDTRKHTLPRAGPFVWAKCQAGALALHFQQCCSSLLGRKLASFPFQLLPLCRLKKHLLESHNLCALLQNIPAALARTGGGKGCPRAGKAICTTTQPTVHLQLDVASTEEKRTLFGPCERDKRQRQG